MGKKGIVRDPKIHKQVLDKIISFAERKAMILRMPPFHRLPAEMEILNFYFILYWQGSKEDGAIIALKTVDDIVGEAHAQFKKE